MGNKIFTREAQQKICEKPFLDLIFWCCKEPKSNVSKSSGFEKGENDPNMNEMYPKKKC